MSYFFDFLELIKNEVVSLLDICPPYIQAIFMACMTTSIIIALKRAIID